MRYHSLANARVSLDLVVGTLRDQAGVCSAPNPIVSALLVMLVVINEPQ